VFETTGNNRNVFCSAFLNTDIIPELTDTTKSDRDDESKGNGVPLTDAPDIASVYLSSVSLTERCQQIVLGVLARAPVKE
jgi:hypothetical protein